MNALALALLLQATAEPVASPQAQPPAYALGLLPPREFSGITGAKLIDFAYSLKDGLGALHTFKAGVQFGARAVARARLRGDDRTFEFENDRFRASFGQIGGEIAASVDRTGPRTRVETRFVFHPRRNGDGGVTVESHWTRNLSDRLDLTLGASGETKDVRFPGSDRSRRFGSLGLMYQKDERFDGEMEAGWRKLHTPGDLEFDETFGRIRAAGAVGRSQYDLEAVFVDRTGKYAVRNASYSAKAMIPLRPRLLLETAGDARQEFGGELREYRTGGAFTWFARRISLSRSETAAHRAIGAARAARANGYFERARFDLSTGVSHRDLRQRMSLRGEGDGDFERSARDLHEAEVNDRNVPLLGVSYEEASRKVTGESSRSLGINISAPWPARLSLAAREEVSAFLRLDLLRRRTMYGAGLVSVTKSAGLTLELNRELELRVSLAAADPTPAERLKGIGSYRILAIGVTHAYGR